MNSFEYQLKQICALMADTKIKYAVLGGIAVSVYGEPRATLDIDVNVIISNNKTDAFLRKAQKYGFFPLPANIKRFIKNTGVIPMRFSKNRVTGRCDFIIAQNVLEYSGINRARYKKLYSSKIKLINPEDLFIQKIISARLRDIEDAIGILVRQRGKLDLKYITFWLKKISKVARKPNILVLFKRLISKRRGQVEV